METERQMKMQIQKRDKRGECQGYQRRRKKEPSQSNQDTERDKELAGVSCRGLNRLWVDEAIRVASTFRR